MTSSSQSQPCADASALALKACPFCGQDDTTIGCNDHDDPTWYVQCGCTAGVCDQASEEKAVAAWNHRASSWKTIETAPMGGTFLAFAPHAKGGYVVVACRSTEGWVVDTLNGVPAGFTHWQEQPETWSLTDGPKGQDGRYPGSRDEPKSSPPGSDEALQDTGAVDGEGVS